MSAVAPNNRAASATLLLALVVTSSWCLASAIPAPNGRRLQQLASTRLPTQLQGLATGATNLNAAVQLLLQTVSSQLSAEILSQLQPGAASLATGTSQLQTTVQNLLAMPDVLAILTVQATLVDLLSQFSTNLQTFVTELQILPPDDGCFSALQARLLKAINNLITKLQEAALGVPAGSLLQLELLIIDLQDMGSDAAKVNSCDPGLAILQRNGDGVVAAFVALIAAIQ